LHDNREHRFAVGKSQPTQTKADWQVVFARWKRLVGWCRLEEGKMREALPLDPRSGSLARSAYLTAKQFPQCEALTPVRSTSDPPQSGGVSEKGTELLLAGDL